MRRERRAATALWTLILVCVLLPACTCVTQEGPPPRQWFACVPQHEVRATVVPQSSGAGRNSGVETVAAGAMVGAFSVTSTGEASFVLPLEVPRGRAGLEPRIALRYDSAGGESVVGQGFSISGAPAITRCPKTLSRDGESRSVRYDADDKLCLDGLPLVLVGQAEGLFEYRTSPDTFVKVVGHDPDGEGEGAPQWFEVIAPTGTVTELGTTAATRPRGPGGVPRAWLAAVTRDGRGNAMTYGYCFADTGPGEAGVAGDGVAALGGYTAEYALDEIRYTHFGGSPGASGAAEIEAPYAVKMVYGVRPAGEVRTGYSRGMALQRSLVLEAIETVGPGEELVRRYAMTHETSPGTGRRLLSQIEECAADGVCKPPVRLQYQGGNPGFLESTTGVLAPTARKSSPLLLDVDGDGLDDLVIPDTDPALSTAQQPITRWLVAHNESDTAANGSGGAGAGQGGSPGGTAVTFSAAELSFWQDDVVVESSGPSDPSQLQPEVGTVIDYDQDGRDDVLLHDVWDQSVTWKVLLARPGPTFELVDTGIARPFPVGSAPAPPVLASAGGSMHLADVDGDRVPDLIQCEDHNGTVENNPAAPVWRAHLWRPAQGEGSSASTAGFDPGGEVIEPLAAYRCNVALMPADLDGDGKVSLVVPRLQVGSDGSELASATYQAVTRFEDGSWGAKETGLPAVDPGGRVVFLDVNGDGLPDAVASGVSDGRLYTYLNTGAGFQADRVVLSLPTDIVVEQDTYFHLATVLDWNGDGRQDLLVPVPPWVIDGTSVTLPSWAVLQANGGIAGEGTFTPIAAGVPFEPLLGEAITLADPRGARVGDLNGDGAADVVLPVGGVFHVFENRAADQDVLVAVSDGLNAHDPDEPGHVPSVQITYGHLVDTTITRGLSAGDPEIEEASYVSRSSEGGSANGGAGGDGSDCAYPRRCVVGARRVVAGYSLNDGAGGQRHHSVKYRDGRSHALGEGFLGFGKRIVTDLDTGAGTIDVHDTATYDPNLGVFPLASVRKRQLRYNPALEGQPHPGRVEMTVVDFQREVVPSTHGRTYFTLPVKTRLRRAQGDFAPNAGAPTLLSYVESVAASGAGATLLRDTTAEILDFDAFGNVLSEQVETVGVNLTHTVERTFFNDTERWVLGQLHEQVECSAAGGPEQCRTTTWTTTIHGEVDSAHIEASDVAAEAELDVAFERDVFGNVIEIRAGTLAGRGAGDGLGEPRKSTLTYDEQGFFPLTHVNPAGHVTRTELDPRLGVVTRITDPNGLVTKHAHDGFGRLVAETHPDGTTTTHTLSRTRDGGPDKDAWRVRLRTTTTGGADHEVELDSLGRPIRWWWYGPTPIDAQSSVRLTRAVDYDPLTGAVAASSMPIREDAPDAQALWHQFEHDALGREIRHEAPWGAVTTTEYDGLSVIVTDPTGVITAADTDALGRNVSVTDALGGTTTYAYGPFGRLTSVVDPEGAVTQTAHDALGHVRERLDPDRGKTTFERDGFGDLVAMTNALGQTTTFTRDALGRVVSRVDLTPSGTETTTWTWDTADHGTGKLHQLTSPDGVKTYAYDALSRLERLTLEVAGATLRGTLGYDTASRVKTITYPTPQGAPPFVVERDHDAHGHVQRVRDATGPTVYWQLNAVDAAGRYRTELLGNDAVTERTYDPARDRLSTVVTEIAGTAVQALTYAWDARSSLASRTDALQPQNTTERFRYDALDRLTCTYFSDVEDLSVPCASEYTYSPSGNLLSKTDVGALVYGDSNHPHAVTAAGGATYSHDAAGRQTSRPAGTSIEFTLFDLPRSVTQGASTITFGYDGAQNRIRKTAPDAETLYFGDAALGALGLDGLGSGALYERVTTAAANLTVHRYHVSSPERVIAVVTRGGPEAGTLYLHADHLGSVDVLTNQAGAVVERRSHDAFGQRRNPEWGAPPPATFDHKTTLGFTGHETDTELGLVNMRGRLYDPRLARFLTTDPIVADLNASQAWNPYSYVRNNPLSYIDPTGFDGEPEKPPILPIRAGERIGSDGSADVVLIYPPRHGPRENRLIGDAAPPTDIDTTGSSPGPTEPPMGEEADDWVQNPYVQVEGGFLAGTLLGMVPFAGFTVEILQSTGLFPKGSPAAERGLAAGQILTGIYLMVAGVAGEVLGGALTTTGIGAALGVPAIAVSTALVAGGAANVIAGVYALSQSLSGGSGGGPPQSKEPAKGDQIHHIMTNKNNVSPRNGGPWTPKFEDMAKKAGMSLEDAANKVRIPGHRGPHPEAYHEAVFERLKLATKRLTGDAYAKAFRAELDAIGQEAATTGTYLNQLLVK